jgi:hypothetical protein
MQMFASLPEGFLDVARHRILLAAILAPRLSGDVLNTL